MRKRFFCILLKILNHITLKSGSVSGIRIRITVNPWIRIRIKAYADRKHCLEAQ